MSAALGPYSLLGLSDNTGSSEGFVGLIVKIRAIGNDEERVVTRDLPKHLLGEKGHRNGLTASLRVPEDAQPTLVLLDLLKGRDGVIDAEVLVVLSEDLDHASRDVGN